MGHNLLKDGSEPCVSSELLKWGRACVGWKWGSSSSPLLSLSSGNLDDESSSAVLDESL